jgi:iron complex transport system permease protein
MRLNTKLIFLAFLLLLAGLFVLDICSGSVWLLSDGLWSRGEGLTALGQQLFINLRLPRALTAILAGAALSVSGLMMQTLFRNPLAGPYILGVSSGAGLGVALVTMASTMTGLHLLAMGQVAVATAAVIGALAVLLLVLAVSRKVKNNVSLLIVGMMIGSIAGALVSLIQNFANPDALKLFIVWTLGSLSSVGWTELTILAVTMLVGAILVLCLVKPLNGLLLGENYARSLGVNVERTRTLIVIATCLLAGGITAFCGPIAFVGVAVPHIARGIFSTSNHRITAAASALIGANLLLVCDIICNVFTYPLPISTMSALFGAPIIIWIIVRK